MMVKEFRKISSINIEDEETWKDKIFLTFDVDWAHDEILSDVIDLVESANVAATWYVTHDTLMLQRLRSNHKFELGIHPNFNFLLDGDGRNGQSAQEVIRRLKTLVPEAKSVRSHSMTQSSGLLDLFKKAGLTHDANHFVPIQIEIELKPWTLWNGLIRVPYNWEDDISCMYGLRTEMVKLTSRPGLKVFDFHPIHVFLNTENLDRYERTRHLHRRPDELIQHRYKGKGTWALLMELLELAGR